MKINILYFAAIQEELGIKEEKINLKQGQNLKDLVGLLITRGGVWKKTLQKNQNLQIALNHKLIPIKNLAIHDLSAGDEVALFPQVTGG